MLKKDLYCLTGCLSAAALFSTAFLTNPHAAWGQETLSPSSPASSPLAAVPASVSPAVTVTIVDGPQPPRSIVTQGQTVGDVLSGAGILFTHQDRIVPSPSSPVTAGTKIVITRVHFTTKIVEKQIPFRTVFQMSQSVAPGSIRPGKKGVPGILALTYRTGYVNGKASKPWLVSRVVTRRPVNQETLGGIRVAMAAALPSRGGAYNRLQSLMMVATGYTPYEGSGSGRCATGMRAGYGVVAVDPRVIRLGSRLYIQGYGYAVAGDTGGAIRGRRIDLGSTTYQQAIAVGRRDVKVWVLAPHH